MAMETMKAKLAIAKELRQQSDEVFRYRVAHFEHLSVEERLLLAQQSSVLMTRAEEVLADALEEGTDHAEELIQRLEGVTSELQRARANLATVSQVLTSATKVAKAAAGIISGGIPQGLSLLG